MYDIAVEMIGNLFRMYVNRRFMHVFFGKGEKKKEVIVYLNFFVLTNCVQFLFYNPILNILSNIIGLFIITYIYHYSFKTKCLVVFLVYIISMVCDILSVYLLGNYVLGSGYNSLTAFITALLVLFCELLIEKIVKKRKTEDLEVVHGNILILVPISSIVVLYMIVMNGGSQRYYALIESMGILLINIIIFYLYEELRKVYMIERENYVFRQQTQAYAKQLDILVESDRRIHSLKHDIKHHFTQIGSLASQERYKDILAYVNNMAEFTKNPNEFVNSGNRDIDSILNYMLYTASMEGAEINVNVTVPMEMPVKNFDLNVILGNLLDNAIEALKNTEEKKLILDINFEKRNLFIHCKNTYSDARMASQKEHYGIGMENIKKIAAQYDGIVDTMVDGKYYVVTVLLYTK